MTMKKVLISACLFIFPALLFAQTYAPTPGNLAARQEFENMKFGMFIHWGVFSVPGDGEWVMNEKKIRVSDYKRLINVFDPEDFDAAKWVAIAKNAGMKYITFITRHHDGFSNWDTKQSDWKITNTRYKKDALKQLSDECKKQGIKLFCYYSLLDWSRPDYQYTTGHTGKSAGRTGPTDWNSYINFMKAQLTELLTNYGDIAGIWFDGHWDQVNDITDKSSRANVDWHYDDIYALIHKLQPNCLIGNNHHLNPFPGEDFQMFEKDLPGNNTTGWQGQDISALPLETCETMNDHWGYSISDYHYKTVKFLIQNIITAAGRNANYLLNIGPMANGEVQVEFRDTLAVIGSWMSKNGESYYGTRGYAIPYQDWGVVTAKDKQLYVHILKAPSQNYIFVPGIKEAITGADLLSGNKIKFRQQPEGVFVYTEGIKSDGIDLIVRLHVK
jgi:alpha-L-fucosidase